MPEDRAKAGAMAQTLSPEENPPGLDVGAVVDALEGVFASAFVRAVKPIEADGPSGD